jgi:glycosyltransferase involved in cell wall biosynthesis
MKPLRVAVFCDFLEEQWPSMDLVADMLLTHLQLDHSNFIAATRVRPPFRRRLTSEGTSRGKRFNADRLFNRFWDYPRLARLLRNDFDLFHVVDHSYGQLLHELPPERTIITCHDLDTFQCLLTPEKDPRSVFFRKMIKRSLSGFQKAARVTCDSAATRDQLLAHHLVPPDHTLIVPNGVDAAFSPNPNPAADSLASEFLGAKNAFLDVLHVGSTIPRKRIDTLLQVFAVVRREFPQARLIRVGDAFTSEQERLLDKLAVRESVLVLPRLDRNVLAAVYRRAALVLMTSEREGFGLPVVEGMACGSPVVASDLPVLREVGADAIEYCPVANVDAWSAKIIQLLTEDRLEPVKSQERREAGIQRSKMFTWSNYAETVVALYAQVMKTT